MGTPQCADWGDHDCGSNPTGTCDYSTCTGGSGGGAKYSCSSGQCVVDNTNGTYSDYTCGGGTHCGTATVGGVTVTFSPNTATTVYIGTRVTVTINNPNHDQLLFVDNPSTTQWNWSSPTTCPSNTCFPNYITDPKSTSSSFTFTAPVPTTAGPYFLTVLNIYDVATRDWVQPQSIQSPTYNVTAGPLCSGTTSAITIFAEDLGNGHNNQPPLTPIIGGAPTTATPPFGCSPYTCVSSVYQGNFAELTVGGVADIGDPTQVFFDANGHATFIGCLGTAYTVNVCATAYGPTAEGSPGCQTASFNTGTQTEYLETVGLYYVGTGQTGGGTPLTISQQPADQTVNAGAEATFNVAASGGSGTPTPYTFQWYSESPDALSFSPISGATDNSYLTGKTTYNMNGTHYKVLVGDSSGDTPIFSSVVELTVTPLPKPVISCPGTLTGSVDSFFSQPIAVTNCDATANPCSYQFNGTLPSAVSFNSDPGGQNTITGQVSGVGYTPCPTGSTLKPTDGSCTFQPFTLTATNSGGSTTSCQFAINITVPAPTITNATVAGTWGQPLTYIIQASFDATSFATTSALPPGLLFNPTGQFSTTNNSNSGNLGPNPNANTSTANLSTTWPVSVTANNAAGPGQAGTITFIISAMPGPTIFTGIATSSTTIHYTWTTPVVPPPPPPPNLTTCGNMSANTACTNPCASNYNQVQPVTLSACVTMCEQAGATCCEYNAQSCFIETGSGCSTYTATTCPGDQSCGWSAATCQ